MARIHELVRAAVSMAKARRKLSSIAEVAKEVGTHPVNLQHAMSNRATAKHLKVASALRLATLAGWDQEQKADLLRAWLENRAGKDVKAGIALEAVELLADQASHRGGGKAAAEAILRCYAAAVERLEEAEED